MKNQEKNNIRKRIAGIVHEYGSQNNLSKFMDFEQKKISNYLKTGNPSVEFLIKLYRQLGISPLWVIDGVAPKYAGGEPGMRIARGGRAGLTNPQSAIRNPQSQAGLTYAGRYGELVSEVMSVREEKQKYSIKPDARDSVKKLNAILEILEQSPSLIPALKAILDRLVEDAESGEEEKQQ